MNKFNITLDLLDVEKPEDHTVDKQDLTLEYFYAGYKTIGWAVINNEIKPYTYKYKQHETIFNHGITFIGRGYQIITPNNCHECRFKHTCKNFFFNTKECATKHYKFNFDKKILHKFLHNHPNLEKRLLNGHEHVIIDRDDWEKAIKTIEELKQLKLVNSIRNRI